MTFEDWLGLAEKAIHARNPGAMLGDSDLSAERRAFDAGESPIVFAARWTPPVSSSPLPQPEPVVQVPEALSEPRYRLDTGQGVDCPVCLSKWIQPLPKTGTGFSILAPIGTALAFAAADSLYAATKRQPYRCCYCDTVFVGPS